jgi:DNA-binding response OmpR family regulator
MVMARVLVIEDEDPLRRIIMMNLVRRGHSVTEAESADAARDAIACAWAVRQPFDVLLLDLNLPDQPGWDILRWLDVASAGVGPSRKPHVIIITAVHPAQRRLEEFRPDALLIKPFPIDTLLRAVDRVMDPQSSIDAEREALEVSDG